MVVIVVVTVIGFKWFNGFGVKHFNSADVFLRKQKPAGPATGYPSWDISLQPMTAELQQSTIFLQMVQAERTKQQTVSHVFEPR